MRAVGIILTVIVEMTAASGPALAQATTPNVVTPIPGLSTPLTFTTTTCMMVCNSQASNCRTACFVPSTPAGNATGNTTCIVNCGSSQLACQSNCALASPSR